MSKLFDIAWWLGGLALLFTFSPALALSVAIWGITWWVITTD